MHCRWKTETERSQACDSKLGLKEPTLVVDVQGFEGPLDLLLQLARNQKVDLSQISIVALVEQYLYFVDEAQRLRLELAADYLLMAAWMAYLKSRLLVPQAASDDDASGEELAELLQFRLRRLASMRTAAERLSQRNRLGRDIFKRGRPEMIGVAKHNFYDASLYEVLLAYASIRQKNTVTQVEIEKRKVWSLKAARQILLDILGNSTQWTTFGAALVAHIPTKQQQATAIASTFAASLEMVREGQLELRQSQSFAPIYIKLRPSSVVRSRASSEESNA